MSGSKLRGTGRSGALALLVFTLTLALSAAACAATPWVGGEWGVSLDGTKFGSDWEWDPSSELLLKSSLMGETYRLFSEVSGRFAQHGDDWDTSTAVERLYLRMFFSDFDLTVGKQQINWGTGRAWSPSDLFNPPVALDPDRRRNGVNAVLVTIPHGPLAYTSLIAAENELSDSASLGMRYHGYTSGTDWSVLYVSRDEKPVLGGDIATDLMGLGIHSEMTWEPDYTRDQERLLWLVGADYSWRDGKVVWMGEYLYDSTAASSKTEYPKVFWSPDAHLAKHSLFNQVTLAYDEFNTASLHLLSNLVDGSQAVTLGHSAMLDTQWRWDVQGTYFTGARDTEYGGHADILFGTTLSYLF